MESETTLLKESDIEEIAKLVETTDESAIVSPTNHYVDNKKFYADMVKFREDNQKLVDAGKRPIIPNSIGKCILEICTRLSYRYNFINYTAIREEMISDAILNCITYIWCFDPNRFRNPFGYFSFIATRAFIRRIQKEKKQHEKMKLYIEHMRLAPKLDMTHEYDREIDNMIRKDMEEFFGSLGDTKSGPVYCVTDSE